MNSLRARIAILLITSIIVVVALASLAAYSLTTAPGERLMESAVNELELLVRMVEANPAGARAVGVRLVDAPPPQLLTQQSEQLTGDLKDHGLMNDAVVWQAEGEPGLMMSIRLRSGEWLVLPMVDFGPPDEAWVVLAGWIALIVAGAIVVSLVAASTMTRPLLILDQAIARVGDDGVLPLLPETGPLEVMATAGVLNRLSTSLRAAMESRMRLVAAAGHDLRTPITRMRLRAEFLSDVERENWLVDLGELERIADSAIDLVREELTVGDRNPLRLDYLLLDLVQDLAAMDLKVAAGPLYPALVRAAPLALTRAFRNLLMNAALHGGGALVELRIQGCLAVATITDNGPGIPEELIGRVFEPFFRVDPARRQFVAGAGLGLAIAKEIIGRSQGRLSLANRPSGGVLQTVTLPLMESRELASSTRGNRQTE